jgi:hypothetical protein
MMEKGVPTMKTTKITLGLLLFLVLITSACSTLPVIGARLEGSGNLITEERRVSNFDRVSLSGFGDVTIQQGENESLSVRTDDNILPYIKTEVRNQTLELGFTPAGSRRSINPSDGIHFDLVVKDISRLDISGAGSITTDELAVEKLEINLSGAGSLEINNLEADELVSKISGAGSVLVAGQVTGQELNHSGVGSYYAGDLESDTALIKVSGAGSATLWVQETLDVKVSGVGNIIYYGTPRVIQEVSGLGKVISQGEK